MAAEGEERLLTMYADVHYYFTEPSPRPASHRMDKGSYVYLYRQAAQHKGRIEVANHAGTEHQDAFSGSLSSSKVTNKYKHPNLVTIAVDGMKPDASTVQDSEHEWRLPSTDPRDEGKYLFRLHTMDIYFWTVDDARTFVNQARTFLTPEQLDIDLPPPPAHPQQMSPVVQQLESVAISDPAYHNGQTRNSKSVSEGKKPVGASPQSPESGRDSANFTPLAYNPAAPAAPEKRAHREKTPPPPEEEGAPGHAATSAAHNPHATPAPYNPSPFSGHSVSSPPPGPGVASSPHSGYGRSPSNSGAHPYTPGSSATTAVGATTPGTPGHVQTPTPTAQILGDSYVGAKQQPPLAHVQPQYADYLGSRPQPPPGGFANYNYAAQQPQQQAPQYHGSHVHHNAGTGDHGMHSQVYRPTEEEHYRPPKKSSTSAEGGPSKYHLDERAEKAGKKFGKFLRNVEKKIG